MMCADVKDPLLLLSVCFVLNKDVNYDGDDRNHFCVCCLRHENENMT